jgi:hypothetical protein
VNASHHALSGIHLRSPERIKKTTKVKCMEEFRTRVHVEQRQGDYFREQPSFLLKYFSTQSFPKSTKQNSTRRLTH